jgi:glycosyltransferase involved in cell wall biosynthesis
MKVKLVSYSDAEGGAARAAYRIHRALCSYGFESHMDVASASVGDWTVNTPVGGWAGKIVKLRHPFVRLLTNVLRTKSMALHSPNILPSGWPHLLNQSGADIIHLHLMAQETMSIADIGKLQGHIVWTLHDMWAFCGAEHFTEEFRWRDGYTRHNRPTYESGFDLNRWTWKRKLKHWRRPMHIVTPSRWLAECVQQSAVMQGWPVSVVPNAIDTDSWMPIEKDWARKILHLPSQGPLLLFGAMLGTRDPRKGFNLLKTALQHLRGQIPGLELVVLGQHAPKETVDLGFPIHYTGHLNDDVSLRLFYSAADTVIVPSQQDNLPNCALEAHACGRPVVAFDVGGLPDIIEHKRTGYLAKSFDTEDLARGILWTLDDSARHSLLCAESRRTAVEKYSFQAVAEKYLQVYQAALHEH